MKPNLNKNDDDTFVRQLLRHPPRKTEWTDEEIFAIANDPSHLPSDLLFGYVNRELDESERVMVEEHTIFCDFCLDQLLGITQLLRPVVEVGGRPSEPEQSVFAYLQDCARALLSRNQLAHQFGSANLALNNLSTAEFDVPGWTAQCKPLYEDEVRITLLLPKETIGKLIAMQVQTASATAEISQGFAVSHMGLNRAEAEYVVASSAPGSWELSAAPVEIAELGETDSLLLIQSLEKLYRRTPGVAIWWRQWAKQALQNEDLLPDSLRITLEQIAVYASESEE